MAGRNLRFEYDIGEVVLCFEPDPTKARVLYDAKVVEQRTAKDAGGRKKPAYVVHFQGWNSSWDRQVGEHYLLRNTSDNRELMRKLAETAKKFSRKNSQRRRKINAILHEAFGGAPPEFDPMSDTEDSEDESDSGKKPGRSRGGQEKKRQKTSLIEFEIPDSLRVQLEDDYFLINKKNKLTRIPAKPCIVNILESFMKTFCVNYLCDPSGGREKTRNSSSKHTLKCSPDKCISLCKEFVDSLRIIFDFTLPIILLYAAEQQQYEAAMKDLKPSDVLSKEKEGPSDEPPQKMARSSSATSRLRSERSTRQHPQHPLSPAPSSLSSEMSSPAPESQDAPLPFRITRRSVHEIPKPDPQSSKSKPLAFFVQQYNSHPKSTKHLERSPVKILQKSQREGEAVVPIASRTRQRSQLEIVELSEGPLIKQEPTSDHEADVPTPGFPGPSQSEHQPMNGQEGACSAVGTESMTLGSSRGREDAMDRILGWQLLPPEILSRGPIMPSQIYGTVHLLRMFVKLPDLLRKMHMKEVQMQIIIKFIHHCLHYLVDHQSELIHEQTYIKA